MRGLVVNLALSLLLAEPTKRIGILDLDVFGPSIPKLMGLEGLGEAELTPGWFAFFLGALRKTYR